MNLRIKALLGTFAVMGGVIVSSFGVNANPVHDAVQAKDFEMVRRLCKECPEWINERDDNELTPLMVALHLRDWGMARCLVENCHADVNLQNRGGATVLYFAIFLNADFELIKSLLEHGANVNLQMRGGITPLLRAVYNNSDCRLIQLLLDYGADVRLQDSSGSTPLHCVTNPHVAELLLRHGSDVNAVSNSGGTPLDSVYCGFLDAERKASPSNPFFLRRYMDLKMVYELLRSKGAMHACELKGIDCNKISIYRDNQGLRELLNDVRKGKELGNPVG